MTADPAGLFLPNSRWVGVFDTLSALVATSYDVGGIWVSGWCISASLKGRPDAGIVTAPEMLEVSRQVAVAAGDVPVVVDCDLGFGDSVVFEHTTELFCRTTSVSALCIEDKAFPKRNSFYQERQSLEHIDVFCDKIENAVAVRDRARPDLRLIARTEALVTGEGPDIALERLGAYERSGADALLVQAKSDIDELIEVARRWKERSSTPLICVPTKFPEFSALQFWNYGFEVVVYANQMMRAATRASMEILDELLLDPRRPPVSAEGQITTMQLIDEIVSGGHERNVVSLS